MDKIVIQNSWSKYYHLCSPYPDWLSEVSCTIWRDVLRTPTIDNGQIESITSDDDVKQFISTLYEKKKGVLAPELEVAIKERLGL